MAGKEVIKSPDTSRKERKQIFALYLSGVEVPEIAKQFEKKENTTGNIILALKKELESLSHDKIIALVQNEVIRIIDCHQLISAYLMEQYVRGQKELDRRTRKIEQFQGVVDIDTQGQAYGAPHNKQRTNKPGALSKERMALNKDITLLEAKLIMLGKEVTYQNKAFVDMITRIGVPRKQGERGTESHTLPSAGTGFGDLGKDLPDKTAKYLKKEAVDSEQRQREYLKERNDNDSKADS